MTASPPFMAKPRSSSLGPTPPQGCNNGCELRWGQELAEEDPEELRSLSGRPTYSPVVRLRSFTSPILGS